MKTLIAFWLALALLSACGRETPEAFIAVPTPTPAATPLPGDTGYLPSAGE